MPAPTPGGAGCTSPPTNPDHHHYKKKGRAVIIGQYYTPILSSSPTYTDFAEHIDGWAYSHDFDSGLKLMEHSWTTNPFVDAIVRELARNPRRLVWAGDYADPESTLQLGGKPTTLYSWVYETVHLAPYQIKPAEHARIYPVRWLVNHSRKVYVNMQSVPKDKDGWRIHPLPLLTCEGNGRGGGDFGGSGGRHDATEVGSWAREEIGVLTARMQSRFLSLCTMGYEEVYPDFIDR